MTFTGKKHLFLCFIFSLFAWLVYSNEDIDIQGRVFDREGKSLAGIRVEIVGSNISSETLKDGTFIIKEIKAGHYWLLFTSLGYRSKTFEIEVSDKPLRDLKITLLKEEDILPTFAEVITVTDKAPPNYDITLPVPKTILSETEISRSRKENLAQILQANPGVSLIGKGGYSLVPSIRGLARNRILLIVDGIKLVSERRTGPSGSFINLNDIKQIEIDRGPYSVLHGSDAIGGIINITTHSPHPFTPLSLDMSLGYKTINQEQTLSLRLSGSRTKTGILFEFNGKNADEYSSPSGRIEQSQYSDYDFMFKLNHKRDDSSFNLMLLHYEGHNIGKPSPKSRFNPTWYPRERNSIFSFGYKLNRQFYMDSWNFTFYFYPSLLKTFSYELTPLMIKTSQSYATVQASNLGFKAKGMKLIGNNNRIDLGINFIGRRGVKDNNRFLYYDELGNLIEEKETVSLNNAERSELGLFINHHINLNSTFALTWGARMDYTSSNNPESTINTQPRGEHSFTGYIGSIFRLTPGTSIMVNLGKAFRSPSLSELYYYGLTGRGIIFGNPNLIPEKSINFDLGYRYLGDTFYVGLYGFYNSIDQIIERYSSGDNYFYENLHRGRIAGIEGEFFLLVNKSLKLNANFHHIAGCETDSTKPLNDIPPSKLFLGVTLIKKRFQLEPRITLSADKENPGSSEIVTKGYIVTDIRLLINLKQNLSLLIVGSNLLNQKYRLTADKKGVEAPGKSVAFKLSYSFSK